MQGRRWMFCALAIFFGGCARLRAKKTVEVCRIHYVMRSISVKSASVANNSSCWMTKKEALQLADWILAYELPADITIDVLPLECKNVP